MNLLSPFRAGVWTTLELPEAGRIDRHAALALLAELFGSDVRADLGPRWAQIQALGQRVDVSLVGPRAVIELEDGSRISAPGYFLEEGRALFLDCAKCRTRPCGHVAAAVLALAWQSPEGRESLLRVRWREQVWPLMGEAPAATAEPAAPPPPEGWLEVELRLKAPADARERAQSPAGGMVALWLVPTARRTGRPLKRRAAPKSLAATERKVTLDPGSARIGRIAEQRRLLGHIARYRYADSSSVVDEIARLDAELFEALSQARSVVCQGSPVRVDGAPFTPRLAVEDAPDGVQLGWAEPVRAHYPVGPGYVLTGDDSLRPLAPAVPTSTRQLLQRRSIVTVPTREVPAFFAEVAPSLAVPLEVRAAGAVDRIPPTPVLRLDEASGGLRVAVGFQYGPHAVEPGPGRDVLQPRGPGERPVARDRAAEGMWLDRFAAELPRRLPTRLTGDAAYDFLLDVVPLLKDWVVEVDPGLTLKPRGALRPSLSFRSGVDWFDIHAKFEVDDWAGALEAQPVIDAWRAGRRYVALKDGSVARLPEAWLARHGEALDEVATLRKAGHGKLGGFAAPLALGLLGEVHAAEAVDRWRALADRVRSFRRIPERTAPAELEADLRPYQHRGFRWMCALRDLGLGAVLADDMGLGKTVQTLATLIDTHRDPGPPSLVVAPTSVVGEWAAQAARFAPTLRVHVHHGPRRGEVPAEVDLVVTTYALLRLDQEVLARSWRYVVLDEAQTIKNPASAVTRAARGLDAQHRLALTGTPLENHLLELWSLFHWLMPGFFGSQGAFGQRYLRPIQDDESEAAMEALRARIRPFILRRLKREVAAELPPRQVQVLRCELSAPERALYEQVKHTFRDQVLGRVRRDGLKRSTIQVLEALMRLRQAACDAGLLPFPEAQGLGPSSKRLLLLDLVAELVEEGHRALVFSQWPSLLKRVAGDLDQHGVPYLYLDGSTTQRAALVERFNRPDGPPLFLISLKAGGTGLNLTAADHVVHLDPWWNPAAEDQATDRAHRIGQTRPVMVYRLVAADTVEEKVLELQARKRALAQAAIDAERVFVDGLRREDLEAVFGAEAEPFDAPPAPLEGPPGLPPALGAVLAGHGRLTTSLVREVLALPDDRAARRQLSLWVDAGLLVRVGRGRGTHYLAAGDPAG